jgi:hypothetical protein
MAKRFTEEDCERIIQKTKDQFGDLVPEGGGITPEKAEQITVLTRILVDLDPNAAAGMLATMLLGSYGKAAPLLARRLVEVYPRSWTDGS